MAADRHCLNRLLETIVRAGSKPVEIAFLLSSRLGDLDTSTTITCLGRLYVVDFTAGITLPLIITQESGTRLARLLALGSWG